MKIGILTMTFNNNYGGMLQAYALMTVLKNMGHEPELINVQYYKKEYYKLPYTICKRIFLKHVLKRKNITWIIPEWVYVKRQKKIEQHTQYFIDTYINPKTKPIFTERDFKKHTKKYYDAYIVGSDQVWRPTMYRFINHAFFDFVKNDSILLLSYAASFGVDVWEFTNSDTNKYKQEIKRFKGISVREMSGVDLCKKHFEVEAQVVLDPTMLLSIENYKQLAIKENEPKPNGDLLFYLLDKNKEKENLVNIIAKEYNYTPFNVTANSFERTACVNNRIYPSVTSWIQGFADAKYVVTDSFHGTVFAIIFNKPFLVVGNHVRGFSRFTSLLTIFGLEERLVQSLQEVTTEKIRARIDWSEVNKIWNAKKMESINFIQEFIV